jgi:hypothetical protein
VRSSAGVSRVNLDDNDALYDLKVQLEKQIQIPIAEQVLSFDAGGMKPLYGDERSLRALKLVNGQQLHVKGNASITVTPRSAGLIKGENLYVEYNSIRWFLTSFFRTGDGESKAEPVSARQFTPRCTHGPRGGCHHCMPADKGSEVGRCDHGPNAACSYCTDASKPGEVQLCFT